MPGGVAGGVAGGWAESWPANSTSTITSRESMTDSDESLSDYHEPTALPSGTGCALLQRNATANVGLRGSYKTPVIARTLLRPEGERFFLLFPAAEARGTIVFLPGTGGTAAWAARETRLDAMPGFHVVVPEAMRPYPQEPATFLRNPPRWNDGSPPPTPELATNVDDVGFLNALLDELDGPIFLTGFSNGAGMAFRYAAECAERLAAVAPIAGLWWASEAKPSKPLPTYYLLGLADPLIPSRGGEVRLPWGNTLVRRPPAITTLEAWAGALGCTQRSRIVRESNGIREEQFEGVVEFRATFLEGFGHHWPGGRGELNQRIAGPLKDGFDLNAKLAEFFAACGAEENAPGHGSRDFRKPLR